MNDVTGVRLRPASVDDADAIARLTSQLGYEVTAADAARRLARILNQADHRFVVAGIVVDSRIRQARVLRALGYANLKTPYSFAKPLAAGADLAAFLPRV